MINSTKSLHDQKVKSLADKYISEGFHVLIEPQKNELPLDLDGYLPDIIATKNESGLIIDVKNNRNQVSVNHLQSVVTEISKHPGWRFLLVTIEDIEADLLPGKSEQLPSWEELINSLNQARKLIDNNQIEPAFLFIWNIFEGVLRKRAVDLSISMENLPVIRLVKSMYSLGEISISQFDLIQACLEKRNHLAHGYIQELNVEVFFAFVNLVFTLLKEWISNISENQKIAVLTISRQTIASMTKNIEVATAQKHQNLLESVASVIHDETREKKDEILAKIKQLCEQKGLSNAFNDLQHLMYEYCDASIESNNQELNKNQLILHDQAQIAIDTLPTQEQERIRYAISCLENFPDCSPIKFTNLSSTPNYFIATVGIYRIIFEFQSQKVTVVDIVNYNRIEVLYGLLEKAKV
jgi:mRNA-degrading endonuclease RelE of RelBE toxin-antitoxin system